jgi:hypothetical protein
LQIHQAEDNLTDRTVRSMSKRQGCRYSHGAVPYLVSRWGCTQVRFDVIPHLSQLRSFPNRVRDKTHKSLLEMVEILFSRFFATFGAREMPKKQTFRRQRKTCRPSPSTIRSGKRVTLAAPLSRGCKLAMARQNAPQKPHLKKPSRQR